MLCHPWLACAHFEITQMLVGVGLWKEWCLLLTDGVGSPVLLRRRLYTTVLSTIKGFGNLFWVDVVAQIDAMTEQVQGFQAQSMKLPKARTC